MEIFENVLKLNFKEKYKEYCFTIRNNLISALYDIEFLKNINPYTARHKILESSSYKLLDHFISLFWQDLILNISKILENGRNVKSLWNLRADIEKNANVIIKCKKWKNCDKFRQYIIDCRTDLFAHSLFSKNNFKIKISEIEQILSKALKEYNGFQFQVDNTNYLLSNKEIQQIKSNCINGIKGLLKPSIFGNI